MESAKLRLEVAVRRRRLCWLQEMALTKRSASAAILLLFPIVGKSRSVYNFARGYFVTLWRVIVPPLSVMSLTSHNNFSPTPSANSNSVYAKNLIKYVQCGIHYSKPFQCTSRAASCAAAAASPPSGNDLPYFPDRRASFSFLKISLLPSST